LVISRFQYQYQLQGMNLALVCLWVGGSKMIDLMRWRYERLWVMLGVELIDVGWGWE
jgi:hypothetical protein